MRQGSDAMQAVVLILGSSPDAPAARDWARGGFTHVVAINNAWRIRPDWDISIFPEDFPSDHRPSALLPMQRRVEAEEYVPVQNAYGGFVYAGGTMAFTAGYWALGALRPRVIAFFGCDMVYPTKGATHFYGLGTADPLRPDITLQSLEAKAARLQLIAADQGCACVNLSTRESRLVFPRIARDGAAAAEPLIPDDGSFAEARIRETALGYFVPSGRYWDEAARFDPAALRELDKLWLDAHEAATLRTEPVPGRASLSLRRGGAA